MAVVVSVTVEEVCASSDQLVSRLAALFMLTKLACVIVAVTNAAVRIVEVTVMVVVGVRRCGYIQLHAIESWSWPKDTSG